MIIPLPLRHPVANQPGFLKVVTELSPSTASPFNGRIPKIPKIFHIMAIRSYAKDWLKNRFRPGCVERLKIFKRERIRFGNFHRGMLGRRILTSRRMGRF